MTIPHIESFYNKPERAISILQMIQNNEFRATEKMDGFYCVINYENNKLRFSTKSKTFHSPEEIPEDIAAFVELKRYFHALSKVSFPHSFTIKGEAIPKNDFNTIKYNSKMIGDGTFIILDSENYDNAIEKTLKQTTIKFIKLKPIEIKSVDVKKELGIIFGELESHGSVLQKPARTEETKKEKTAAQDKIQQALVKAKHKIINTMKGYYKPILGDEFEGVVVDLKDGTTIKLVDKEQFTEKNAENWKLISEFNEIKKTIELSVGRDGFDEILKNSEAKICDLEKALNESKLSGTIREQTFNTKNAVRDLFEKYKGYCSVGIGSALKTTNSIVPRERIEEIGTQALKELGFDSLNFCFVGNKSARYVGDIDIAIEQKTLYKLLGATEDDFWEKLEAKLSTLGKEYRIIKGLRQFHIAIPITDGVCAKTLKPLQEGLVQVDFLIGDISWMGTILASYPGSQYKSAVKNIFIKALCEAKNITNSKGSMEYSLNFRDGLWVKVYDLKAPEGKQRKVQKELVHKFLLTKDPIHGLQNFLFEHNKPDKITEPSFEFWFNLFRSRYNESLQMKALQIFQQLCEKNHLPFPEKAARMLNGTKLVALYPGSFKPFHRGHYEIAKMLSQEADEVKILVSVSDREDYSGAKAFSWIENWVIPFLPNNVTVEYTDKPILYAFKLAHVNKEKGNKTLLFVDERENKLTKAGDLFEFRTSDRFGRLSGTRFREAIKTNNLEVIKKHLIKENFFTDRQFDHLLENDISENDSNKYSLMVAKIKAASNHEQKREN